MEKIHALAAEALSLVNSEAAEAKEQLKATISAMVHEAKALSTSFELAVASVGKGAATSPAPLLGDKLAEKDAGKVTPPAGNVKTDDARSETQSVQVVLCKDGWHRAMPV